MKNFSLSLLLMFLVGCGTAEPTTTTPDISRYWDQYEREVKEVERLFLREHPDYTVVRVSRDKWDRYADFTISYKKPSDSSPQTVIWHYTYATPKSAISGVRKDPVR